VKIFVAGATGAIGRRLVPLLTAEGHEVTGMSRSPEGAAGLQALGARGVSGDVFDRERLMELLAAERPEVVIDELSDLDRRLGPSSGDDSLAGNRRIRTEGTRNLVDAAIACGARRVVAQSYAHIYAPQHGWVKNEDDPTSGDGDATPVHRHTVESVLELEHIVLQTPGIEGVALRYGAFYGPGTPFAADGSIAAEFRRRHYPVIGDGRGHTSFIHVDDAAAATMLAMAGPAGVFNICDDQPARQSEWAPFYAETIGAPRPRHIFSFALRMLGRDQFVYRATEQRGASNVKAKLQLEWTLRYPSWREGFVAEARRESGVDVRAA
jgi:2-alkyl-3-oxoalkanoate reductase